LRHLELARAAWLVLVALTIWVTPVGATTPACSGRDMLLELESGDAAAHGRVMAAAESTVNARALLWRIDAEGAAAPSYLFGTVHLTDDRVNALSPKTVAAMDGVRRIALEIDDMSPQSLGKAIAGMRELIVFADGRSLETMLSADEFDIVQSVLGSNGTPRHLATVLRPWLVTLSLSLPACERRRAAAGLQALDMRLAEAGKKRGIPVVGLETLEGQMRALAAVPERDQLQMLKMSLKFYNRSGDLMETMVRRYLNRDIGVIWPFQIELARSAGFSPESFKTFEEQMVSVRNRRMRDAALPLLREGGTFIAVGALHLPGKVGLVELFREAGFNVTAID
jgi:uncharacterized protein